MLKSVAKRLYPIGAGALTRDPAQRLPDLPAPMQRAYLPPPTCAPVPEGVVQQLRSKAPTLSPAPCRKVSPRGRRSHRGIAHLWCPGPGAFRQVCHESQLERDVLCLLGYRADFHDVREQVGPVTPQGRLRLSGSRLPADRAKGDHYYDYVVTLRDGTRVAYIVKPATQAADPDFRAVESARAKNLDPAVADSVSLITDADFRRIDAVNAGRLLAEDQFEDPEADDAVRAFVAAQAGHPMIFEVVDAVGLGARAYSAALRQIRRRRFRVLTLGVIGLFTRIASA